MIADPAGCERDADRMQLCCNLIDGATVYIYSDEYRLLISLIISVLYPDLS